ncbi:LysR family transcriptional regulator [Streptococcus equinus]|uniref:DNA-binding transcriptional regulator, LysR family n=1 Tax=Streptococcus equinus TaxID=1335 RepID=A0A1G9ITD5_STREI|nr:LysR family transcriptional regulator [Streptococcus equinus]UOC11849.1 LysR family transcriptional regulator [Streptococcus equinus]SDL28430.1 DNA-binding transcriptional regulator, LysR family [Streptococcus equinus]SEI79747.1 DNA-binding transcriptional regulator, LysR family [Streptococcus equinus]
MDIRVLNYFVTIVQTKSISNAANTLHVTQPTLSRQIKDLEEELDTVLFHRGSREIQLTDDGQYLYNRAIEILALVEKTENNIRKSEEISGEIYIGAAETHSLDIVATVIKKMTDQYPEIRIHIRSGNADDILEHLNKGVYDLGITIGDFDNRKYNALALKNRDQWGVLVPKNHPLTKFDKVELADILSYPLITSAQTNNDLRELAGLGDYHIVATYNLLYNASLLVKAGLGIAICLGDIINTSYTDSELKFIPFATQKHDSLQILWKKQSTQSPSTKLFLKLMQEEIEK